MKIDRATQTATRGMRPGARGRAEKSDGFLKALAGSAPAPAEPHSGPAPAAGLDALLALQEVASRPESDSRARRRGEDLLERLDELHLALLSGRLSPAAIRRLADLVAARLGPIADPRLADILDEIELRAAVELAKLSR